MQSNTKLTDKEIEFIWDELGDIPFTEHRECEEYEEYEELDGALVLNTNFFIWKIGTTQDEIWHWFDYVHSLGVGYLINERDESYNDMHSLQVEELMKQLIQKA